MQTQRYRAPGQPPPVIDISDKMYEDIHPPRFLSSDFDLNGKETIVTISKVTKEPMWNQLKQGWDHGAVIHFEEYARGIKGVKKNTSVLRTLFGNEIRSWIGKKIKLICVYERAAGKEYHLVRISNEQVPQQETPVPPSITEAQTEELNAFGTQLYGENWPEKSVELVQAITKTHRSITELTEEQAQILINGIVAKINEEYDGIDTPDENEEEEEEEEPVEAEDNVQSTLLDIQQTGGY